MHRSVDFDDVLTVPNAISVARLLCVPWFLWLLFGADDRYAAAWLLGVLGATDWVDGWIARRFDQVSELGKVLDPTADRVLLIVGIGAIVADGAVPLPVAIAALTREVLVAATVLVLAALGAARIDVQWAGKAGTFALMVAFPLFLVGASDASWAPTAERLAWIVVVPGLLVHWYAALAYVPLARNALARGRVGSGS